ncbi:alpha/beta hydrolase family protein [Caballeronia mineralivorans]|uniref:alpha/beta hydrolase family protein n=1 Tax=Caballeronia mineralivorans TaxID=2010198 RepID=UPI00069F1B40
MMLTRYRIVLLAFSLLLSAVVRTAVADDLSDASIKPEAPLNERMLNVPGDAELPVTLQVTVYMPSGPGPFPLAVMNHGSTSSEPPAQQPRYHLTFSAYYFLSRGYAVAMPMMRGYAGSGGYLSKHGCDDVAMGLDAARDIRAVIGYMKQQPKMDSYQKIMAMDCNCYRSASDSESIFCGEVLRSKS